MSKPTYVPSLLYFHEEILSLVGIKPTIAKTGPERRDLMMKEIENASGWSTDETAVDQTQLGLYDKVYLSTRNTIDRMATPFKRIFGSNKT